MNLSWLLVNSVSALLLPPLSLILLAAVGLGLYRRWPRRGAGLLLCGLLLLVIFSTQAGTRLLLAPLEEEQRIGALPETADAQAIVVLGGGRLRQAPEYGGQDQPSLEALSRLRHAARLQRRSGLPLLLTGGRPDGAAVSEAEIMAQVLREDFAVPVRWLETVSRNTAENARASAAILHPAGVRRILLVSDAVHLRRARQAFSRQGFDVIPAPTTFMGQGPLRPIDFVPNARELARSAYALHEWIGLLWYRLRHA